VNQTHTLRLDLIPELMTLMSQFFLVNQTHTVQLVQSDFWTNDSYESILFSESNTYSAASADSLISELMTLMSQFFLVNQTHTVQSDFWTNDSYESILFSESNTYNAAWFLNQWLLWVNSF